MGLIRGKEREQEMADRAGGMNVGEGRRATILLDDEVMVRRGRGRWGEEGGKGRMSNSDGWVGLWGRGQVRKGFLWLGGPGEGGRRSHRDELVTKKRGQDRRGSFRGGACQGTPKPFPAYLSRFLPPPAHTLSLIPPPPPHTLQELIREMGDAPLLFEACLTLLTSTLANLHEELQRQEEGFYPDDDTPSVFDLALGVRLAEAASQVRWGKSVEVWTCTVNPWTLPA